MEGQIKNGTKVSWTSQSQGTEKKKTGVIVAFVPRGHNARKIAKVLGHKLNSSNAEVSICDRYLVDVPRGGKSNKSDLYAPRASQKFTIEEEPTNA